MAPRTLVLALLALSVGCAQRVDWPMQGINALAGDRSWLELHGTQRPGGEDARVAAHLRWAEQQLRAAPVRHLAAPERARRAALLDALRAYVDRGRFPRRATREGGRRPRFVDEAGTHCAVAELVRVSVGPELVAAVASAHQDDYVADMRAPALSSWASAHGFTLRELALIQPSYEDGSGVDMPSPVEERRAEEARRRAARVPRPLSAEHMREVLRRFDAHAITQACAGAHTGHWAVATTVSVGRDLVPRTSARVTLVSEPSARVPELETCIAAALRDAAAAFIASAAHRYRSLIEESHWQRVDVYSAEEIEAAFLARTEPWHAPGTRTSTLRECMSGLIRPLAVPVRVMGWNGEVRIRWDTVPTPPVRAERHERERWYCVQAVLGYGQLTEHGARDHDFEIEVMPDGTLRRAPSGG